MSFALFDESGSLKSGKVLSDNGTSLQIELVSGRRAKVKVGQIYLRFDSPEPEALLPAAERAAGDIDVDFLWECAPEDEFSFETLAADYFGGPPDAVQATALLTCLQNSPIHFRRKGRGLFRAAPEDMVKAALAGLEKRRAREAEIETMTGVLSEGGLPEPIAASATELLVRPDKQSVAWKALEGALARVGGSAEALLLARGAFASPYDLHLRRFLAEFFPAGREAPAIEGWRDAAAFEARVAALPPAEAEVFSIDDSNTTEIDDGLSVQSRAGGGWRVGIHIAVPGLVPAELIDPVARERMSTVYMPGDKITMLDDSLVAAFSLDQGGEHPALSLYADIDADGGKVLAVHSRLERVRVVENLRHDLLDERVTEQALEDDRSDLPHGDALRVLWRLTLAQCAERERVRGKPEPRFRTDYAFRIDGEQVQIEPRRRDAPLSRIVAEMMILANSRWGGLLAEHGIAGVYRSQQGGRVRVSTQALPHEGLGVAQYIWSTSPLRRYIDLINQRQLLAMVEGSRPPLSANSADLFSVIPAFDARLTAYQDFQSRMERFWCLRWIGQQERRRYQAQLIREDLVRLTEAPLVIRMAGLPEVAPGHLLTIDIQGWDLLELSVQARYVALGQMPDPLDAQAA
ncbi:MAG: RNB domain-containing ribonuclease [Burkholderiaceae bacterium]